MKINQIFQFRSICGESMLVPVSMNNVDYSCVIHLNETAAYLWQKLNADAEQAFEIENMVSLLLQEYEVTADVALADCKALAEEWTNTKIILP